MSQTGTSHSTDHPGSTVSSERADLLQSLATRRFFLRFTVRDLTDEQAARRTTVSRLCLGGLIKHVASVEQAWINFALDRPGGPGEADEGNIDEHERSFDMLPGETLAALLERYQQVAQETDEIVAAMTDLDTAHPLPQAPWFEPGAHWSNRLVLQHVIAETAQHAGHADIIREALDGAKSMG
jgi:uncharacterized damage-inducible protein DinB